VKADTVRTLISPLFFSSSFSPSPPSSSSSRFSLYLGLTRSLTVSMPWRHAVRRLDDPTHVTLGSSRLFHGVLGVKISIIFYIGQAQSMRAVESFRFRRYTIPFLKVLKYSYSCCCCTLARARNNKAAGRCGFQKNGFPKTQAARYDGSFLPVRTRESNQGRPSTRSAMGLDEVLVSACDFARCFALREFHCMYQEPRHRKIRMTWTAPGYMQTTPHSTSSPARLRTPHFRPGARTLPRARTPLAEPRFNQFGHNYDLLFLSLQRNRTPTRSAHPPGLVTRTSGPKIFSRRRVVW